MSQSSYPMNANSITRSHVIPCQNLPHNCTAAHKGSGVFRLETVGKLDEHVLMPYGVRREGPDFLATPALRAVLLFACAVSANTRKALKRITPPMQ